MGLSTDCCTITNCSDFQICQFYSGFFAHCMHIYSALRKSLKKQQQSLWKSFLHYTLLMYYTYVHFLHLLIHTYSKSSSSAERIFFSLFLLESMYPVCMYPIKCILLAWKNNHGLDRQVNHGKNKYVYYAFFDLEASYIRMCILFGFYQTKFVPEYNLYTEINTLSTVQHVCVFFFSL